MIEIAVNASIIDSLNQAQRYRQLSIPVSLQPWQRDTLIMEEPTTVAIVGYTGRTQETGRVMRRVVKLGDKVLVSPNRVVRLWLKR